MHELPVTKSMVELASAKAKECGLARITRIDLVIGELSSMVGESIQMYFDFLSKDTPAEGAVLNIKRVNATLECNSCGYTFERKKGFNCPECGGECHLVKGTGSEFYIESIEAE